MKRNLPIFLILGACLAAGLAADDHQDRMKAVGAANGSLRKNVAASAMAPAAKDAQTIADLLKEEGAWWKEKNVPDAVKFASDGETAARSIAEAAGSGNADGVTAGSKALGATCGGCHAAHREKTDSGYAVKM